MEWKLEVDFPFVAYQYSLRWHIPGDEPDQRISGDVRDYQRALLSIRDEAETPYISEAGLGAMKQFDLLCKTMRTEVCRGLAHDNSIIALFVYDTNQACLVPVLKLVLVERGAPSIQPLRSAWQRN